MDVDYAFYSSFTNKNLFFAFFFLRDLGGQITRDGATMPTR